MNNLHIPYCEFYITNVCNLACPGCNRFNNYHFTGYQKWQDYADEYRSWSQEVTIGSIAILGGEPLLNPTFLDWVNGIRDLWPRVPMRVITNGYHLLKVKNLYETVRRNRVELWVGIHNKMHKKQTIDRVHQFLQGPISSEFDDSVPYQHKLRLTDANGITVVIEYNWWFHQGALVQTLTGFIPHNSDAEKAHQNCHMKDCHHFIKGKLYKCGVVALLPEFEKQHNLIMSTEDQELLLSYRPLEINDDIEVKKHFIGNLSKSIPQCKFCPEVYHGDQIFALEKKDLKI